MMLFIHASATEVYKWVDKYGQVHFGSKPKSEDAKKIKIKDRYIDSGSSTPPQTAQERADQQQKFVDALTAEEDALKADKDKKEQQDEMVFKRCVAAKDQLKRMQEASGLYDLDEKGNRVVLNKKQYEQAMQLALDRVTKWCN